MLTATLFSLGMAAIVVGSVVSLSLSKRLTTNTAATFDRTPTWDGYFGWERTKADLVKWLVQCQEEEAANRKKCVSWAGTFLVCSAFCLIGMGFQLKIISIPQIVACAKSSYAACVHPQPPQATLEHASGAR